MSTLLLRLAGPMQSWGTQSRFTIRDTAIEPSKSGVIGLICAALGRPRNAPIDDLVQLRMGVRVDQEGALMMDYHTAGGTHRRGDTYGVALIDGKGRRTLPSRRYYLADAAFLVGLEGDQTLLQHIDNALANPVWPLFLGRKSFVPGVPIRLPDCLPAGPGLREQPLAEALSTFPRLVNSVEPPHQLRLVVDAAPEASSDIRRDVPISFAERRFSIRYVRTDWIDPPSEVCP